MAEHVKSLVELCGEILHEKVEKQRSEHRALWDTTREFFHARIVPVPHSDTHLAVSEESKGPTYQVGVRVELLLALQGQMVVHRVKGPAKVHKDGRRQRSFTGVRGLHMSAQPH